LAPVYHIGILDFLLDKEPDRYINHSSLINKETLEETSDKLNIITVELPKFNKTINELTSDWDIWLYCFRNMHLLKEQPESLKGHPQFDSLFEAAEIENLTETEMEVYAKSVAEYHDVQLMMECSLVEGREEGLQKGLLKGRREGIEKGLITGRREGVKYIAKNLLKMNLSISDIVKATGLTPEQIKRVQGEG
jgi:predicted transposase/invertase (TIGR01784 family)